MNVVFIVFNRPDLTRRVFAKIAEAKPQRLFLVADGPRLNRREDVGKVSEVREVIAHVDWPCEVRRDYSEINLGCRRRVSSGLDWVFSLVEDAIILEDDCLPHADFFRFCVEMLEHFRFDQRIGHISGTNFDHPDRRREHSYLFSIYSSIWGWATWRRCWQEYDADMKLWRQVKATQAHRNMFSTSDEARYFEEVWDELSEGRLDAWGARWLFARLVKGTLSVRPSTNLVTNIGFGHAEASHTTCPSIVGNWSLAGLPFPLRHPEIMVADRQSDQRLASLFFRRGNPLWRSIKAKVFNKHWYGKCLRQIPVIGGVWARGRGRKTT